MYEFFFIFLMSYFNAKILSKHFNNKENTRKYSIYSDGKDREILYSDHLDEDRLSLPAEVSFLQKNS